MSYNFFSIEAFYSFILAYIVIGDLVYMKWPQRRKAFVLTTSVFMPCFLSVFIGADLVLRLGHKINLIDVFANFLFLFPLFVVLVPFFIFGMLLWSMKINRAMFWVNLIFAVIQVYYFYLIVTNPHGFENTHSY